MHGELHSFHLSPSVALGPLRHATLEPFHTAKLLVFLQGRGHLPQLPESFVVCSKGSFYHDEIQQSKR